MENRIEEIRAREQAATAGEWHCDGLFIRGNRGRFIATISGLSNSDKDNENFIAHARQDIPYLLDEIDRLNNRIALEKSFYLEVSRLLKEQEIINRALAAESERD